MKKIIIFGTGVIADAISWHIERDQSHNICAYSVDGAFVESGQFLDKPVVALEDVARDYPPSDHAAIVAIGYQGMNQVRAEKCEALKSLGYTLESYVSPQVNAEFSFGENCIVMDNAIIQPRVTLANNVFVWGGAMIGHHAKIGDNCWITGSCAIGGLVDLGQNCFVGLNTTIGNEVTIGEQCMLGAGTLVTKSLQAKSVLIQPDTPEHRLDSDQFARLSSCFQR